MFVCFWCWAQQEEDWEANWWEASKQQTNQSKNILQFRFDCVSLNCFCSCSGECHWKQKIILFCCGSIGLFWIEAKERIVAQFQTGNFCSATSVVFRVESLVKSKHLLYCCPSSISDRHCEHTTNQASAQLKKLHWLLDCCGLNISVFTLFEK